MQVIIVPVSSLGEVSKLGLLLFLSLLKVLGSYAFVLLTYVKKGRLEVRLGNIHIDLDMLFLKLLDFLIMQFLQNGNLFLQGIHFMLKIKMC